MIDPNVQAVIDAHKSRAEFGLSKYGTDTTREDVDLAGWLRHAQEEAMDLAVYLQRIISDIGGNQQGREGGGVMHLFKLTQTENDGWDTFDSCIVVAQDPDAARLMHPYGDYKWDGDAWFIQRTDGTTKKCGTEGFGWTAPDNVTVEHIGIAREDSEAGVVLASFNAG